MAKYICDFELVSSYANKVNAITDSMQNTITNYEQSIVNDTSGWNSDAKNNFIISNTNQAKVINGNIQNIKALADFLEDAVAKIQEAEAELSAIKI